MRILQKFRDLCRPAQIYLLFSLIGLIPLVFQNMNQGSILCVGNYECELGFPNVLVLLGNVGYMLIWTIILQSLCRTGYKQLSWFFVLIPFIMFFILIGLLMLSLL